MSYKSRTIKPSNLPPLKKENMMNVNINLEKLEVNILDVRAKMSLLKYLDPNMFTVKDAPIEVQELLHGVVCLSEGILDTLDASLDNLQTYTSNLDAID